jgi:outer membrane protein assembly factor BamB
MLKLVIVAARCVLLALLFSSLLSTSFGQGSDWPQILGPNRDGVAVGQQVRRDWGGSEPAELWQKEVGQGLAGVAVAEGRTIVFHRLGDEEVVEALNSETGDTIWTHRWPTYYTSSISPDSGPRCVPVVHGDAVYAHGAAGQLVCMNLTDGKPRWSRDTFADFDVRQGYFGAGSTPIVVDDLLLLNVGGRKNGGVVAFSLATGKTVWQVPDEQASYSSPTVATLDEVEHVLFVTRYNFLSVNPKDGMVRFRVPFGQRGPTVNGATPLLLGKHVFLSASYGIGARWIEIGSEKAEVVWSRDDLMSSQYSTCVAYQGNLYGLDGRQDGPPGRLRCFDPATGEAHWSKENFGMATLIRAGNTLLVMKTDGELVLVDAHAEKYQELARWQLLTGTARALPALAANRVFVRDERVLKCFDLSSR